MKKSFMTRALATGLSLAMAFSLSAATNVTVASAASKPAMVAKQFAVRVGGATKTYKANAATRKAYNITKAVAGNTSKAQVAIATSKKGVKVTPGTVTGSTVVKVTFKNIKTKKTTAKKYRCSVKPKLEDQDPKPPVVEEAAKISAVTQKAGTALEVTLTKAVSSAAISDFGIVRDESNAIVAINTASVNKTDGTKVELTTYESLTDGKTYTVTYTATDAAKTKSSVQFTATDGVIDSLNLTPLTISAGKATTIKYQTIDKNGVVLSEKSIGTPATGIEVNTTSNDGYYTSAGNLYLAKVDDTATIKVSYHTYKYDPTTGLETGVIEKTFTIKAVDSASVADYEYTIAKDKPSNWASAKKNTQIAMEDTDYKAFIRIKDADGDALSDAQASEYSVESSNNSVLIAAGTADGPITLTPVAQGSAYLIVSKDGKTVASLPVTVGAKRVLTTVSLSATSVTIATNSSVTLDSADNNELGKAVVNVTTLDQYGVKIKTSVKNDSVTNTSKPAGASGSEVTNAADATKGKITISSADAPAGNYGQKITCVDDYGNEKSAVYTVRVVKPGKQSAIQLVATEMVGAGDGTGTTRNIDTTFNADSTDEKKIKVYAVGTGSQSTIVSGQPLSAAVSVSAIKVAGSDGTVYAASGAGVTPVTSQAIDNDAVEAMFAAAATNGALEIKVRKNESSNIRKYLPAGSYTVTYTIKDATKDSSKPTTKTYSMTFTIKDEQPATTVKVIEPNIGSTGIREAFANQDYVVFYYDGVPMTDADGNSKISADGIKAVIGATAAGGTKATVKYVVAQIPVTINDAEYTIDTVVPVNVTFTGSGFDETTIQKADALKLYS